MKERTYSLGFITCASTEIFERLAYYLGRSLILIFITTAVANGGLGLSETTGASMQSDLTAYAYLGALGGGIIVDRFVGARYTTPVGCFLTAVGYYLMSIAKNGFMIYAAIAFITIGLGLFRIGAMIGRIVTDRSKMDAAFSIRYTLVNIGAFIGTFTVGILYKDVFAKDGVLGFVPCFRLAAVAMVLGGIWFMVCSRFMGDVGKKPFKYTKTEEELEEEAKQKAANKELRKIPMKLIEKKRIGAIFLVSGFSIIFWLFWYLAYLPVYYHWTENMNWVIAGYEIPVTWFDAANSILCIVMGPLSAKLWLRLAARPQGDMSLFKKIAIGIGIVGLGYVYYAVLDIVRGDGKISVLFLILFVIFLTLGEMFFSPLGNSFISKYSPSRFLGVMISVWGFATFIGAKCYAGLYKFAFDRDVKFYIPCIIIAVIAFISTTVLFILDKRLNSLVEEDR